MVVNSKSLKSFMEKGGATVPSALLEEPAADEQAPAASTPKTQRQHLNIVNDVQEQDVSLNDVIRQRNDNLTTLNNRTFATQTVKMRRMTFEIPDVWAKEIRRIAFNTGLQQSEIVRIIIGHMLENPSELGRIIENVIPVR